MLPLTDNPNRYQINPEDDRALAGIEPAHTTYFQIAVALDALEELFARDTFPRLDRNARRGIRSADQSLRRAAWAIVATAERED